MRIFRIFFMGMKLKSWETYVNQSLIAVKYTFGIDAVDV